MMHTACLRCGKHAVSLPDEVMKDANAISYTHYSYCEDCLREGLKLLKERDKGEKMKDYTRLDYAIKIEELLDEANSKLLPKAFKKLLKDVMDIVKNYED